MIQPNNNTAARAEKNTSDRPTESRECIARRCNFSHSAGYNLTRDTTSRSPPPSILFSGTLQKTRTVRGGVRWERLMRATRERTNGRRAARDFENAPRVYVQTAREHAVRSDCYTSTAGIVIAVPAASPASTLRVCTRVPAIRNCTHPHTRECNVQEQASGQTGGRTK